MPVRLPDRSIEHIRRRHPEVSEYLDRIASTVVEPDMLLRARTGEYKAIKLHADLLLRAKYLIAVYRHIGQDKVIITSCVTSHPDRIKGGGRVEKASLRLDRLDLDYDEEADVLYVSFGAPRAADDTLEVEDGVVYRLQGDEVIGITITGLKNRARR